MPTIKTRTVYVIKCVQKVGGDYYPRVFAYKTAAERLKNFPTVNFSYEHAEFDRIKIRVPVPTRREIIAEERAIRHVKARRPNETQDKFLARRERLKQLFLG